MRTRAPRRTGCWLQRREVASGMAGAIAVGATVTGIAARADTVVEYCHAALDHYFATPLASEIDALDSGRTAGWRRTGLAFDGFAAPAAAGSVAVSPVCRFYIPPIHGDSHFLSAAPDECAVFNRAPMADGLFVGDYQGLAGANGTFVAFYTLTP